MTLVENRATTQPASPASPSVETDKAQPKVEPKAKKVLQPKQPQVAALQPVGDDEEVKRSTTITGKRAEDTFSFRLSAKGPRYQKTVTFDFSDCTPEDILNMALRSARIDLQKLIRDLGPKGLEEATYRQVNVKHDLLGRQRSTQDPKIAEVRGLMQDLGAEEVLRILNEARAKKTK